MPEAEHIINKVLIEVNTKSSKEAFNLKDNLAVFLQHQVFPEIERYFDTQSNVIPKAEIRFNRIELDINTAGLENLNDLKSQIVNQLKNKIDAAIQKKKIQSDDKGLLFESHIKSHLNALLYFLKTGLKPWWKPDLSEVLSIKNVRKIILQKGFYSEFVKILVHKNTRERLVNQFDDELLSLLLGIPGSKISIDKQNAFSILKRNVQLRRKFWIAIMEYHKFKKENSVKTVLSEMAIIETKMSSIDHKVLETYASLLICKSLKDVEILQKKTKKEESIDAFSGESLLQDEGLFINNAGLVLLHPFLKQFFINVKLADSNGKIIQSKIETAIHLMHYLGTKNEQQLESELILEKFLCGYPIEQPMGRFVNLSEELKQMAEVVLQSTITHWVALKNTSPDGLRTAFLQREGKLILENNINRIVVERKAQDLLLDKLPWNIHVIKLPWRDKIIFVEW